MLPERPKHTALPRRNLLQRARGLDARLMVIALLLACAKQGEGERCDINNGDLDCDTGLRCTSADQLNVEGRGVALCCPVDENVPTVTACLSDAQLPDEETPPADPPPVTDAGDGGP